jgi:hypothetical protein
MSANVVAMPGKALCADQTGGKPNEEVIGYLRALLDKAEAGEVQAVGYAYVDHEGELSMREVAQSIGDARDIMSGLHLLAHQIAGVINAASAET